MSLWKAVHQKILLVLCGCLATSSAFASTLLVTESGLFSASTPTSLFSKANGAFSLSFNVESTPEILTYSAHQFAVAHTNFVYTVDGLANTATVGSITFHDSGNPENNTGLFTVCFTTSCPADQSNTNSLVFFGTQLFTGNVDHPTFRTGTFANNGAFAVVEGRAYLYTLVQDASITAVTPEPSSIFLLGTGLLAVAGIMRRKLKS